MATSSKYFLLPSTGANFVDFELSYGTVSLQGQEIVFVGSTSVDAIFVRPGVVVDFTLSGASADKIYLAGNQADYNAVLTGSVMTLSRGSGETQESVRLIKATTLAASDKLVFADGTLSSFDLYANLKDGTALPALSGETSLAPAAPAAPGSVLNANIKAFALDAGGETFAPAPPGIALTVVGGVGIDTVYVPDGGTVDATQLGGNSDLIYLRGNWADYAKTVSGSVVTFTRTVGDHSESVKVVAGVTVTLNDKLIFADGAVLSNNAKLAISANANVAISAITGYDAATVTPGIDSTPPALEVAALGDGDLTAAEAGNAGGVVSVTTETGANVSVEFTGSSGQVAKYLTGNGTQQNIVLDGDDLIELGDGAVTVATIATDAHGNSSTSTDGGFNLDTTLPVLANAEVNGDVLTLTYTEASSLDAVNKAAPTDFSVLVNGNPVAVDSVAVNGKLVNLTLASSVANGSSVSVSYTGSGTAAIQDLAGNDAATLNALTVSVPTANVADGYIRDADIYIDTDNNGSGDFNTGISTNASGNFILPPGTPTGTIIAIGGVNIDTGIPNTLILKAPSGSTTVSPLTTLIQAYVDANSVSAAAAETAVQDALGLPAGVDLLTFDPLASSASDPDALAVQQAAAQISIIAMLAASAPATGSTPAQAAQEVFDNLVIVVTGASAGSVNLSNAGTATGLLGSSTSITPATVSDASTAIGSATSFTQISDIQAQALDNIAPAAPTTTPDLLAASDSGRLNNDDITSDNTPTVRVHINTSAIDGTAAVAGNDVKLFDGATQIGSGTLNADDIANGFIDITTSTLTDGVHGLTATLTDSASNVSSASSALSLSIDTGAPTTTFSNLALSADTGSSASDFITKTTPQTVHATLSASLASGEFIYGSTNGGSTWSDITGSVSDTVLAWNTVLRAGDNSLQLKVVDSAGNDGLIASQAYTLDTTTPTLSVTAIGDNAKTAAEAADAGGVISVNAENGASVTVLFSNGTHTVSKNITGNGTDQIITLSTDDLATLGNGTVNISTTATDTAGNARSSSIGGFNLDTVLPGTPAISPVATDDMINAVEKAAGVTVSGTAETGASIEVTWGASVHTITASAGVWSTNFTTGEIPADGTSEINASATDAAGNTSSTAIRSVSLDTIPPSATAAPTLNPASDTGDLGDNITSDTTPTITGITEADATVTLMDSLGGGAMAVLGTTTANAEGAWSITSSALSEGTHQLIANVSDAAQNVASSPALSLSIVADNGPDLTAPTLLEAKVNGTRINLVYDEALDPAHQPAASFYSVSVNGLNRAVDTIAIDGNSSYLTLRSGVSAGDTVTLSYNDPSAGNDVYAIQDLAGNDAASLNTQALTNNTVGNAGTVSIVNASISETANADVSLVFNEPMQASGPTGVTILKNGIGSNILTGADINGSTVTFHTSASLTSTDFIEFLYNGSGDLRNLNETFFGSGTLFVGGSGINTINLNNFSNTVGTVTVRANGGADVLTGSENADNLNGGGGPDVINGGWSADNINLSEATRSSDTVVVGYDGSSGSQPYFFDSVFGFDVSGTTNNDKLNLPSNAIAPDASHTDGIDVGVFAQHSIANGIITFEDASGNPIHVTGGYNATTYLLQNLTTPGQTVAFQADIDNNGYADSLFVYQHLGGSDIDNNVLIKLAGVTGVTLGTSAAQNVVQIVDTTGPTLIDADFSANTFNLYFNEALGAENIGGLSLQKGNAATLTGITLVSPTISGNQLSISLSGANLTGNDYVLITPTIRTMQNVTDTDLHSALVFQADEAGIALGGSGDTVINLAGITGNYGLYDPHGGNDTLIGNASNNELEGGAGNDNLQGGGGNDYLNGGTGADTLDGGEGADKFSFTQGDSTPVSHSDDVYTFTGGADVISGGFTTAATNNNPDSGDRIHLRSAMPGSGLWLMDTPFDRQVVDQQFFLERGDYNGSVFTANAEGTDTLLVYDGDSNAGVVSQTALVIENVNPTQLTVSDWGNIYLNGGLADTTAPTNTGASFSSSANSVVTLAFDEVVTSAGAAGLTLDKNPSQANGWIGTALSITNVTGLGTNTVNFTTNNILTGTDVIRARYDAGPGDLADLSGNPVASGEIWIGGSGNNTIDLSNQGSSLPIVIRGNGGNDTLTGSWANDVIIDGTGTDLLVGGWGADIFRLVENGVDKAYARDVIKIGLGESPSTGVAMSNNAGTVFDIVLGSLTSPTDTGFDISSATVGDHDVLDLPSNTIAGNVSHVDGIDSGALAKHSISSGILSFEDASGNVININMSNAEAAINYLEQNITTPGTTVAFEVDTDNNGSADSLLVFQDAGTIPLSGNFVIPDIAVVLGGITSATLGTTAGDHVVQIQDTQAPEPVGFAVTNDGFALNFTENTFAPETIANLALTMQKNGAGSVFTPSSVDGNGTASITTHFAGLTLAPEDWALLTYAGTDISNAFRDASDNPLANDGGNAIGFVEGGSGNNNIDISALSNIYDINGNAGNDTIIGNADDNWIDGGTGADTMTGGAGLDDFGFEQGDSPAVTNKALGADGQLNTGDTFSFANGVDRITDLGNGEQINLNAPNHDVAGQQGPTWMGLTPSNGQTTDQAFFLVQGNYSGSTFSVDTTAAGHDTLLVYDGDPTANVSQTAIVLSGVTLDQLQTYTGSNTISRFGVPNVDETFQLPAAGMGGQTIDGQDGFDTLALGYPNQVMATPGGGLHFGETLDPASNTGQTIFDLVHLPDGTYHLSGFHLDSLQQPVVDYDVTLRNIEQLQFVADADNILDVNLADDIASITATQAVSGVLNGNVLAASYQFASYEAGAGVNQVIGGASLSDTVNFSFELVSGEIQMVKDESGANPVWRFNEGVNEVFSITESGNDWAIDYDFNGAGTDVTLSNFIEYAAVLNSLDHSVLMRLSFETGQPTVII